MKIFKPLIPSFFLLSIALTTLRSQEIIGFDSEQWQVLNGKTIEHLGRQSFMGTALLKDVDFTNGVIEVDVAITGARSYPGINFRIQSKKDYEHFYIRPHRAGLYPDALQYAPTFNGIGGWQLYSGSGYTAGIRLPVNEWIHLKLEVLNDRAQVFINDQPGPALQMYKLKHGISSGTLGLNAPANGTAYFSNFRYTKTEDLKFKDAPIDDFPIGMIQEWEISQSFKASEVDFYKTPLEQGITDIKWQTASADPTGLIDIGKYRQRQANGPDMIFAKTTIKAQKDHLVEYRYGYSDAMMIFLNGKPLCFNSSAYQQRDPSFLGIIGLNDAVFLPLKKGDNELLVMVAESFGGWGFMFKEGNATYFEKGISKAWETEKVFATSESVLYDPKREVVYVTNFDQSNMGNPAVTQSISKLNLKGEVLDQSWIKGLNNPLGITIYKDKLYVSERGTIAIVDLKKREISERIPLPASLFLNDIAVDKGGNIYISDSRKSVIWKVTDGNPVEWLKTPDVANPNVLYLHKNNLYVGNSSDHWLKAVDLSTKKVSHIARFPEGFIDGVRVDNKGNLLVSLWEGKIYRVDSSGKIELIFHTQNAGHFTADFEYIPKKQLLLIPTFFENRVVGYKTDW